MLNRVWRIVLLVIALITLIWGDLLGASTWWISVIAVAILLIAEVLSSNTRAGTHMPAAHSARKKRRK